MISNLDLYHAAAAAVLVKRYGEDAPVEAAMRADGVQEVGDLDGYAVWRRVLRAVEGLQEVELGPGVKVH